MARGVRLFSVFVLAAASLGMFGDAAGASTLSVTNTNDSGPGSLRQAVVESASGDTILIPPGTYTLTSGELTITKSLTLDGSGPGATIVRAGGAFRVLHVSGKPTEVTVTDMAIREGTVAEPDGVAEGGAVLDEQASLRMEDVDVEDSHANASGAPAQTGGVALGGGIYATGPLSLSKVAVNGSSASAVGGGGKAGGVAEGGGVFSSQPAFSSVTLDEDSADARGGQGPASAEQSGGVAQGGALFAVLNEATPVALDRVEAHGAVANAAAGPGEGNGGVAEGGGIFIVVNQPPLSITALTASDNLAFAEGGTGVGSGGVAEGGGMFLNVNQGVTSLLDLTIAENTGRAPGFHGVVEGGGLWEGSNEKPLTLASATLDANVAEGDPTGVSAGGDLYTDGDTRIRETIVNAGVGRAGQENCDGFEPAESLGANLDSRDECNFHAAGDRVNTDPLLGPLAENGGGLATEALLPGSPAIDGGATSGCSGADERGVARPQGVACDIGAFELAPPGASTATASAVGTTTATLNGAAGNPDVLAGSVYFQFGTTTAYGSQTTAAPLAAGLPSFAFTVPVSGLAQGTLYHYRAVAVNPDGVSYGADQTFTTQATIHAATSTAPLLSGLAVRPSSLRAQPGKGASVSTAHKPRGAKIVYSDSEAALTTFTVQSVRRGFRVGKLCAAKAPRRHKGRLRRCTRYVSVGGFTHSDSAGAISLSFTGRVGDRPLALGSYRLLAVARNTAGQPSRTANSQFKIIR